MEKIVLDSINKKSVVGIGSGKTIASIMPFLPKENILYIPSSIQTSILLQNHGLNVGCLKTTQVLDIYYDGADFFDKNKNLLKGGGGCMACEKIMLNLSNENIIIAQNYKYVENFEDKRCAIEILPQAIGYFSGLLKAQNLNFEIREGSGKLGPIITDVGNVIFDVQFDQKFIDACKHINGVIDHGFVCSKTFNYELVIIN
ncbi:hypothetical protein COBT_003297 [Conglomerata obtusa]